MTKINRAAIPIAHIEDRLVLNVVEAEKKLEENFEADGKQYLARCPKCKRENWAPAVASGVCAWCGHDANVKREG